MAEGEANYFVADDLDLLIIGELLRKPVTTFKAIGATAKVDQRTIARRVQAMDESRIISQSFDVAWEKLDVATSAIIGCTTSMGQKSVGRLREYMRSDPRVVEAYETVGTHQYILRVLGKSLADIRDTVLRELEPLTADLSASIISSEIKKKDYFQYLRYLRETRYPRTRSSAWGDSDAR
jgi:DNA-binding Lrp family transcriptional regulator